MTNEHNHEDDYIEEFPDDDDNDEDQACSWCGGCGEGDYDGAACRRCHGTGVEPYDKDYDDDDI